MMKLIKNVHKMAQTGPKLSILRKGLTLYFNSFSGGPCHDTQI